MTDPVYVNIGLVFTVLVLLIALLGFWPTRGNGGL